MRPRAELALGLGLFLLLGVVIVAQAWRADPGDRLDRRRSTFRTTETGARGWTDALSRLGVEVERTRRPLLGRRRDEAWSTDRPTLLVYLDPTFPIDVFEATQLGLRVAKGDQLLLAGNGARLAMRCFGWDIVPARDRALRATGVVEGAELGIDSIGATLRALRDRLPGDSSRQADIGVLTCKEHKTVVVDTLLRVASGRPAAVRISYVGGGTLLLVADGELFADLRLKTSDAGPFALALVVPRYQRVVVDEYHHGYGAGGSMSRALLHWSAESPWGSTLWQLVAVGLIALLAAGVRTGPIFRVRSGRRRSAIEHVRALAQALAATRGHDVAVRLLVGGLRRRLSDGRPTRDDPRPWLAHLTERMRTARGREAARTLQDLTRPGQSAAGVLAAANAVEAVWDETRP